MKLKQLMPIVSDYSILDIEKDEPIFQGKKKFYPYELDDEEVIGITSTITDGDPAVVIFLQSERMFAL